MVTANMYALSLQHDGRAPEKTHEDGAPFFVPQLAKVKTNIMCQTNSKHLLFSYEMAGGGSDFNGSTSPTLPYRKQGDKSYYTEENLKKRQKLMEDRKVLAGIGRFWDTFPNIRHGQTAIDRKDYVNVFMKLYKALVAPHEVSPAAVDVHFRRQHQSIPSNNPGAPLRTVGANAALFSGWRRPPPTLSSSSCPLWT